MSGKRVLITGGSGFIGANLARRALSDGHEVHLLLRPAHQTWRIDEIAHDLRLHFAGLEQRDQVSAAIRTIRPEWIFHLAAFGAYSSQQGFEHMVQTNVIGCASLLEACLEAEFEAFVNCGSSSEYGFKDHPATEEELVQPNSHYAITKAAATHYCNYAGSVHEAKVITLRLYSIYGPYEEPSRLIPTLLVHALHEKLPPLVSSRTARDYVYVDDACDAMMRVAERSANLLSGIYNVCTGVQTSMDELVSITKRLFHVLCEPQWGTMDQRSWDTDVWVGSPAKLQRSAGWQARTQVTEGLQSTVAWLRDHPHWLEFYSRRIFGEFNCRDTT